MKEDREGPIGWQQACLIAVKQGAAAGGSSEVTKLGSKDQKVKKEGAASNDGCEEWTGRRGTGVLLPAPSQSTAGGILGAEVVGLGEGRRLQQHGAYLDWEPLQCIERMDQTINHH